MMKIGYLKKMDILAVLLVLAIFKNSEVICNACSLLPGGAPPCFPGAVDYAKPVTVTPIKEITYELKENKEFVYHLKSGVLIIKLGEPWVKTVGTDTDTVVCERDVKYDTFSKQFKTILEYGEVTYYEKHFGGELNFYSGDVDSYFVTTKREVWICKSKAASSQSFSFRRIVTELLSRRSVKELYFYDGIEATFVPSPRSNYIDEEKSIIVREIKYLDPKSHEVLKYEGFLEFHHPENIKEEDYRIFKPLTEFTLTKPDNNKLTDVVSKTGIDLVYNKVPKTVIGKPDDVAECEMKVNDKKLYLTDYLAQWAVSRKTDRGDRELAEMPKYSFQKDFIITKHELWSCKISSKSSEGLTFEMSVLEYIGGVPIQSVEYIDGIELWKFLLNYPLQSVAVRETAYINKNFEYVKFMGWIEKSSKQESSPSTSAEKPPQKQTRDALHG